MVEEPLADMPDDGSANARTEHPWFDGRQWLFRPIGTVHTTLRKTYEAARQAGWDQTKSPAVIELRAGENFEQALQDLEGCDRIWLITVFDRVGTWKPRVLPPRGRSKRGVFATRSPHRPNPIGLTCVRLLGIEGRRLFVEDIDLLDGTPVLDIKPYLAYADAFPDSTLPWVDGHEHVVYTVQWSIDAPSIPDDVRTYAERVLSSDPFPHPYRRIRRGTDGSYVLSIRRSRIQYRIHDTTVTIVDYTVDLQQ